MTSGVEVDELEEIVPVVDRLAGWLSRRGEAIGFWSLLALYLVPVWAFAYLPTQDGPSHLANADILLHYGASPARAEELFEVRAEFLPNWSSHLLLAGLFLVFPPLVAEKLLVTLYVVGFAAGFRYFLGGFSPRTRPLSWLGLLFVYNRCFWMGFYNCCLSLALFWLIFGWCVRRRGTLRLEHTVVLMLLFTLAYFTHLVGFVLAGAGALGAVLLAPWSTQTGLRGLRDRLLALVLVALAALLPVCLAQDYFEESGFIRDGAVTRLFQPAQMLTRGNGLFARVWEETRRIDNELLEHHTGPAVSFALLALCCLLILALYTILEFWLSPREPGPRGAWLFPLLFGLALLVAYALVPFDLGHARGVLPHGGYLKTRLAMLPFMLGLACLREPANTAVRIGVRGVLALLLVVHLLLVLATVSRGNTLIAEYTAGLDAAGRGQRLFVSHDEHRLFPLVNPLLHAADYYCAGTGNVNLDNYEALTPHFPLKLRPGMSTGKGHVANYAHRDTVGVVLCWNTGAPPSWPGHPGWTQVFAQGRLQIYRRGP